jgi:hypothetical protein
MPAADQPWLITPEAVGRDGVTLTPGCTQAEYMTTN